MADDPHAIAARMRAIEAERLRGLGLSFKGACAKCGGKGWLVSSAAYGSEICDQCSNWRGNAKDACS